MTGGLQGTYVYDYDIASADATVRTLLKTQRDMLIPHLHNKIEQTVRRMVGRMTVVEYKTLERCLRKDRDTLQSLEADNDLREYNEISSPLLRRYKGLGRMNVIKRFDGSIVVGNNETSESILRRLDIIDEFLTAAQKFVPVNVTRIIDVKDKCLNCFQEIDQDDGLSYCPQCKKGRYEMYGNQYTDSISISEHDDNETNMIQSLDRFEGIETVNLPVDMHAKLDKYFESTRKPKGQHYRDLPLLSNGKKEGSTIDMLIGAMKHCGYENYYKHFILIAHRYWGWRRPSITHLRERLMNDYRMTQIAYEEIDTSRSSNINLELRKYKHLEILGYPMDKEWFRLPITIDAITRLEKDWKKTCERTIATNGSDCGIVYKSLF